MSDRAKTHGYLLESWLEFHDAIAEHPEIRRLLFDPVTGLPTTPLLFPRIESLLDEYGEISLLCLNVVKYSKIEEIFGWRVFDDVMRKTAEVLEGITGVQLRDSDMVAELMVSGNAFVVLLSPPRTSPAMKGESLQGLVRRIEGRIRDELQAALDPAIYLKFGCYVGAATMRRTENVRLERLVHEALDTALAQADAREAADAAGRCDRLRRLIEAQDVHTLVHPIVRLADCAVIGYEALSRGPEGGEFERPDKLFKVAYDAHLVLKLERLCRHRALEAARDLPDGRLMFLNVEPEAVTDPELREAVFSSLLQEADISPRSLVLEVAERAAIDDYSSFRSTLEYLRTLGFSVAVDDAGAGFGSLECLSEVRPEWLKIDLALVREVEDDEVRRRFIMSFMAYAQRMGVKLIAMGIETPEQFAMLRDLGVEYGQGFLFSLPVKPFPADDDVWCGA